MASRCRVLAGNIYVQDLSIPNQPFLPIGNAQAELAIEEEEQTQPDFTSVAGGNACVIKDISSVNLNLGIFNFSYENMALAVFGVNSKKVAGSFTSGTPDNFTVFNGEALSVLDKIPTNLTAVVKVGATTYLQNTDYTVTAGGILVISGSALDIAIAANLSVPPRLAATAEYAYGAENVIEALEASGKTYAVRIVGANRADNAKPEIWDIWKISTGPAASFNVITREFGQVDIVASVLPDDTKPSNESRFFRITGA